MSYVYPDLTRELLEWRRWHDARNEMVTRARKRGMSIKRIHDLTGLSRATIYTILRQHNH